MTRAERELRETTAFNMAQRLSYRVDRYNECYDEAHPIKNSIRKRRYRELLAAVDELIYACTERSSDGELRYFYGEQEVARRDKLLSASGRVTPLKRSGRPVG